MSELLKQIYYALEIAVMGDVPITLTVDQLKELVAEIARLQAERRWIPVSERLPEKRGAYYVYLSDGFGFRTDMDFFENGDWDSYTVGDVTHWMPPPAEPPSEEE